MKYSTSDSSWRYTFAPADLAVIQRDNSARCYFVLVCGRASICCLDHDELRELIDETSSSAQWLAIEAPPRMGLKVRGSKKPNSIKTVPHNRFPDVLFQP